MTKPQLVATTQFKIEKGIPLLNPRGGRQLYPFAEMEIGDSILDASTTDTAKSRVAMAARAYRNKHPEVLFTCRSAEGGVRIWRAK